MDQEARARLQQATGISDASLLDTLLSLQLGTQTVAALSLWPLVKVAAADGVADAAEQKAVLTHAAGRGIVPGSPARAVLEAWLCGKADPAIDLAWRAFAGWTASNLSGTEREDLAASVLAQARAIAESSGSILRKMSAPEEKALADIAAALA